LLHNLFYKEQQKHKKSTVFAAAAKYLFAPEASKALQLDQTPLLEGKISMVMLEKVLESISHTKMFRTSIAEENEVSRDQRPLYKSDLSFITLEKLENYFVLLVALDRNMKEHKRLRRILTQSCKITKMLNDRSDTRINEFDKRFRRESHSISSFMEVNPRRTASIDQEDLDTMSRTSARPVRW